MMPHMRYLILVLILAVFSSACSTIQKVYGTNDTSVAPFTQRTKVYDTHRFRFSELMFETHKMNEASWREDLRQMIPAWNQMAVALRENPLPKCLESTRPQMARTLDETHHILRMTEDALRYFEQGDRVRSNAALASLDAKAPLWVQRHEEWVAAIKAARC